MVQMKSRLIKVIPEVKEWAEGNWPPTDTLENYIAGSGCHPLANIDLSRFAMLAFSKGLLESQAHRLESAKLHMAFGFKRKLFYDLTELMDKRGSSDRMIGTLDTVAHTLLGAVATGSHVLAEPFYEVILSSLRGGYGVFDGHALPSGTTLRYAAFGLSIISDWLGKPLDLNAHALPRDPAWGQLVAHWREPDPDKLLKVLLQACDTHVERIAVTEREAMSQKFEFKSVFLAVHPTEILAILRLRDLLGLPNPLEINHPLMQTPYAEITCQPGEVTERDELLERYLATVRQRDPHVLPPGL